MPCLPMLDHCPSMGAGHHLALHCDIIGRSIPHLDKINRFRAMSGGHYLTLHDKRGEHKRLQSVECPLLRCVLGNDFQAGISFQMIRKASKTVLTLELTLFDIFGLVFLKNIGAISWAAACRTLPCLTVAYRWERGIICLVRVNYIGIAALASTEGDFA
ncbi:hypothetical protein T4E_7067 [Trichinella pseudospiralis]|uniref:Uncharacterized protein n=1 Tax=Trichinella pseudospiralis TaxID=6337 RepID=A0A0V0Y1A0_TRIPS|nr:hypothetical protein T4E_7067 [Trichinella pseudospiralis]